MKATITNTNNYPYSLANNEGRCHVVGHNRAEFIRLLLLSIEFEASFRWPGPGRRIGCRVWQSVKASRTQYTLSYQGIVRQGPTRQAEYSDRPPYHPQGTRCDTIKYGVYAHFPAYRVNGIGARRAQMYGGRHNVGH